MRCEGCLTGGCVNGLVDGSEGLFGSGGGVVRVVVLDRGDGMEDVGRGSVPSLLDRL